MTMKRLRPVDESILDHLLDGRPNDPWGRDSPSIIADNIDYSTQHITDRLNVLEAAGLVIKRARGLWEITDDGIERIESDDE